MEASGQLHASTVLPLG